VNLWSFNGLTVLRFVGFFSRRAAECAEVRSSFIYQFYFVLHSVFNHSLWNGTDNKAEAYLNVGWMGEGWKKSGRRAFLKGQGKPDKSDVNCQNCIIQKQLLIWMISLVSKLRMSFLHGLKDRSSLYPLRVLFVVTPFFWPFERSNYEAGTKQT
jgi:hypothetical protein